MLFFASTHDMSLFVKDARQNEHKRGTSTVGTSTCTNNETMMTHLLEYGLRAVLYQYCAVHNLRQIMDLFDCQYVQYCTCSTYQYIRCQRAHGRMLLYQRTSKNVALQSKTQPPVQKQRRIPHNCVAPPQKTQPPPSIKKTSRSPMRDHAMNLQASRTHN